MAITIWLQIVIGILLGGSILLQTRGSGLGSAWAGTGEFYRTKRGAEKFLFISTIVLAVIFVALTILATLTQ